MTGSFLCPCRSGRLTDNCCAVPERTAENSSVSTYITRDGIYEKENQNTNIVEAIESIETNPDLFAARFDLFGKKVWFVKMTPRWYNESVFLDPKRMKGTYVIEADFDWLNQTCKNIHWQQTSYIFHSAFCGSTLMAQALDGIFNCLPLREPDAPTNLSQYLHTDYVTEQEKSTWFNNIMLLMSRRYHKKQSVVVKTSDYANPLMLDLLEWKHKVPMLFMYTPLQEFLVGCLKANNRKDWIKERYRSAFQAASNVLHIPDSLDVGDEDYGKMAALYWCYNMAIYKKTWNKAPDSIASLDFNLMLAEPKKAIVACGKLFQLDILPFIDMDSHIDNIFSVYSKNSSFKYSPAKRAEDINRILNENEKHAADAEEYARLFLGSDYPFKSLPGQLLT